MWVSFGRMSPSAPRISTIPIKRTSPAGTLPTQAIFFLSPSRGMKLFITPARRKASASSPWTVHRPIVISCLPFAAQLLFDTQQALYNRSLLFIILLWNGKADQEAILRFCCLGNSHARMLGKSVGGDHISPYGQQRRRVCMTLVEKRMDPRVKRTRQLLQRAFLELFGEKGIESISIQEITDRATVNRATFYA